jgi:hypothetical protein
MQVNVQQKTLSLKWVYSNSNIIIPGSGLQWYNVLYGSGIVRSMCLERTYDN